MNDFTLEENNCLPLNVAVICVTLFIRLMCIIFLQSYYKLKQLRNILSTDKRRCVYSCYTVDSNKNRIGNLLQDKDLSWEKMNKKPHHRHAGMMTNQ